MDLARNGRSYVHSVPSQGNAGAVRFRIQQCVERLLDAAAHHLINITP